MVDEYAPILAAVEADALQVDSADIPPDQDDFTCQHFGCTFVGKNSRGLKRHVTMAHGERTDAAPKSSRQPKLEKSLYEFYVLVGTTITLINQDDGRLIIENAENCARAMDKLAAENPAVRKALTKLMTGSAVGGVIIAHAPIIMGLAVNHLPFFAVAKEPSID